MSLHPCLWRRHPLLALHSFSSHNGPAVLPLSAGISFGSLYWDQVGPISWILAARAPLLGSAAWRSSRFRWMALHRICYRSAPKASSVAQHEAVPGGSPRTDGSKADNACRGA